MGQVQSSTGLLQKKQNVEYKLQNMAVSRHTLNHYNDAWVGQESNKWTQSYTNLQPGKHCAVILINVTGPDMTELFWLCFNRFHIIKCHKNCAIDVSISRTKYKMQLLLNKKEESIL